MECKEIFSSAVFIDDFYEQKTEFDIVIPDYCPPAEKILCCDIVPFVLSKSVEEDKIKIEYECEASIVYTDENGIIHSLSENRQDSKLIGTGVTPGECRIKAGLRPITVNCRLANPRHITVRAVIGMAVKAMGNVPFCSVDNDGALETLYHTVDANAFVCSAETLSNVNGSVDTGEAITDVISSYCMVKIEDVKPITDKVVIKANADVYVVYTTGEQKEDLKFKKFTVPFSDVIDAEGVTENAIAEVTAEITDLRCETGEGTEIFADVKTLISVSVFSPSQINIMTDAYSMSLPVCAKKSKITVESLYDRSRFNETVTSSVPCDFSEARIVGIYPKAIIKGISLSGGMLAFDGEIYMKIYMYNDSDYKVSDKSVPFSFTRPLIEASGNIRCEAVANVENITYNMPDADTITVTAMLGVDLNCFCSDTYDAVNSIEASEGEQTHCKGVILYSAGKGELLWDIAKKLRSSVDIIKRDNNLVSDTVENPAMLLISFK